MTVGINVHYNGTFNPVRYLWVNQNGTWTQVRSVYNNVGGVWQQSYPETANYTINYDSGAVGQELHGAGDYSQGYVNSGTYSVTNNCVLQQTVNVAVTFYYGSHVITDSRIYRSDGTLLYDTGHVDWNFNVVYHSTQYRTFTITDTIPAQTTYGYYGSMATFYNGDYNYSVGGNGFNEITINYSSYTWPDGRAYSGSLV